jgi:hypothetical protein
MDFLLKRIISLFIQYFVLESLFWLGSDRFGVKLRTEKQSLEEAKAATTQHNSV